MHNFLSAKKKEKLLVITITIKCGQHMNDIEVNVLFNFKVTKNCQNEL